MFCGPDHDIFVIAMYEETDLNIIVGRRYETAELVPKSLDGIFETVDNLIRNRCVFKAPVDRSAVLEHISMILGRMNCIGMEF